MNLLILAAVVLSLQRRRGAPSISWLLPGGIVVLSLEVQIATAVGWGGLRELAFLNVAGAAAALALAARAGRLRQRPGATPPHRGLLVLPRSLPGRVLCGLAAALALLVIIRGALYVPDSGDPYHLMKVVTIARTGTLAYVPAADTKINVFSFLYELLVADLSLLPVIGWLLVRLHGVWLLLGYAGLIAALARRWPIPEPAMWLMLLAIPVAFHQFVLVKNDFLAFVFGFVALLVLVDPGKTSGRGANFLAGLLAGLAIATKLTSYPLVALLALYLPWRPGLWWRSRASAAVGGLIAIAGGGLVFSAVQNVAWYGSLLGPQEGSGNLTADARAALESLFRFGISLFDMGQLTRRMWPGRGGWGGNGGPLLVASLVVLGVFVRRLPDARRTLVLALTWLALFAAFYPDADLAHRMALAPIVLIVAQALRVAFAEQPATSPFQGARAWSRAALIVAALAGFAIELRSAAAYLQQYEYVASTSLARSLATSSGLNLETRAAWRMRQINAAARRARHACNLTAENALLLDGVPYTQVPVTTGRSRGYAVEWRLEEIDACDFIITGPNDYPDSIEATRRVNGCMQPEKSLSSVSGSSVPLLAVKCDR